MLNASEASKLLSIATAEKNRRQMIIVGSTDASLQDFCVPEMFLLNGQSQIEHGSCKRLAADQKLIEEIDSSGEARPPKLPSVAGFKFVRPVQVSCLIDCR